MNPEKPISMFPTAWGKHPEGTITVREFCERVQNGHYRGAVESIRAEPDADRRRKMKTKLPAVSPSGTFEYGADDRIISHSGFICVDIDAKDNPQVSEWGQMRDRLAKNVRVYFAALSTSGVGVFAFIPISEPVFHVRAFRSMQGRFDSHYGLKIDPSCVNVSRLRFVSYDCDAKINPTAKPYPWIIDLPKPKRKRNFDPMESRSRLDQLIDMIVRAGVDITDGYDNWLEVGRAIVNEYGESGREHYHQLSGAHPKYNPSECDKKFNACLRVPGNATAGTIFYLAKQHGILVNSETKTLWK